MLVDCRLLLQRTRFDRSDFDDSTCKTPEQHLEQDVSQKGCGKHLLRELPRGLGGIRCFHHSSWASLAVRACLLCTACSSVNPAWMSSTWPVVPDVAARGIAVESARRRREAAVADLVESSSSDEAGRSGLAVRLEEKRIKLSRPQGKGMVRRAREGISV